MIALFGASPESTATSNAHARRNLQESAPDCFSSNSVHAMFQALDMNGDGYLCAQDLDRWLKHEDSPHVLHLDEASAFLRAGNDISSTRFLNHQSQSSENGIKSASLSEEGLASCLAHFSSLAFDWNAPLSSGSKNIIFASSSSTFQRHMQGSSFNREHAAVLFRRLDSDSDG